MQKKGIFDYWCPLKLSERYTNIGRVPRFGDVHSLEQAGGEYAVSFTKGEREWSCVKQTTHN